MLLLIASLHKHALAGWPEKRWNYCGKSDLCFRRKKRSFTTLSQHQTEPGSCLGSAQIHLFLEVTYQKQPTAKMRHFGTPLSPGHFFNTLCLTEMKMKGLRIKVAKKDTL